MKIFLLEDDFSLNESIKEMLEAENFIVDSFYDGEIALDNLISNYLVYILDVNTPNIDGLSLLEHIKNINPNSKVLIISANINIDKIKDAYEKGCEDYIKKPFDIEELTLKIRKIVDNSKIVHLSFDSYFDLIDKKLFTDNLEVALTKYEKELLYLLLTNKNNIIGHSAIEDFVYKKQNISLNAIRSLVKRLRKKLPKDLIQTTLEEGYFIK
jgi:DNA-binding response OmpR family regulator